MENRDIRMYRPQNSWQWVTGSKKKKNVYLSKYNKHNM